MYSRCEREPTPAEARELDELQAARGRSPRLLSARYWVPALVVCGVLWGLTLLAQRADGSRVLYGPVSAVWGGLWVAFSVWSWWGDWRDARRKRVRQAEGGAGARTVEHEVRATAVVELEDPEDFGRVWAFQVEPEHILLWPENWEEPDDFPNTEFTLRLVLDGDRSPVGGGYEVRGASLAPLRTLPVERGGPWPGASGIRVIDGRLDTLEQALEAAQNPAPPPHP